jgi:hypothetical protein
LTVNEIADRLAGDLTVRGLRGLEVLHHLTRHAVFALVGAMRRHGRRAPGLGQSVLEISHSLARIVVEHVADGERRENAIVVAAADRLVEEDMRAASWVRRFMEDWPVSAGRISVAISDPS